MLCILQLVGNANLSVSLHTRRRRLALPVVCFWAAPSNLHPLAANLSQLFECLFVNFSSWRENFAVKYFAQILFSHAFVALSAKRPHVPPLPSPPCLTAFPSFRSGSVNCINARRSFQQFAAFFLSLSSFFLSSPFVLLFCTCVLPCIGIFSAYLYRFRSLCCCFFCSALLCFCSLVVACCNVQRSTCRFSCNRFYFIPTPFLYPCRG